ncbi:MAG: cobalamin-dependent protein, partial [Desulfamplus sp.]|nr:cobalamin-dependent protein [Desulfamplus sp.]
ENKPDVVGLSLSIYFNMGILEKTIESIRKEFKSLKIIVGGQAFRFGGESVVKQYDGVTYIASLDELDKMIERVL